MRKTNNFSPEYAGLRALAVLLVAVYHIWFNRVSGGVDVFLMLSAFFLTGSILRRYSAGRSFSIVEYWRKIAMKIVPATVVMVLIIVAASSFLLPGNRFITVLDQARPTLFFTQNMALAEQHVDYYTTSSALASPLQHFWSLSIQGQFYLLWPLLCVPIAWLSIRWVRGNNSEQASAVRTARLRTALSIVLAGVGVWSFTTALAGIDADPQAAYFESAARSWEFVFGGLLALWAPVIINRLSRYRSLRFVLGWAGLIGLVGAGIVLADAHFPGWASLLPLGAAAAIMLSGNTGSRLGVDAMLRWPLLQSLARHSYALYLWHWPVLIIVQRSGAPMTLLKGAGILAVSLLLAVITTKYFIDPIARLAGTTEHAANSSSVTVARPVPAWQRLLTSFAARLRQLLQPAQWRPLLVPAAAMVLTLVTIFGYTTHVEALKAQAAHQSKADNPGAQALKKDFVYHGSPTSLTLPLSSDLENQWAQNNTPCPEQIGNPVEGVGSCFIYGERDPKKVTQRIIAVGDSHVEQWMSALAPIAKKRHWQVIRLHRPSCRYTAAEEHIDLGQSDAEQQDCVSFRSKAQQFILQQHPDAVYTLGSLTWKPDPRTREYPPETVVPGYEEGIRPFLAAGINVIAQRDTPRHWRNLAECVDVHDGQDPRCTIDPTHAMAATNPLNEVTTDPKWPGKLHVMDMTDMVCPDNDEISGCPAVIGNVRVYLDEHHLTRDYVRTTIPQFEKRFISALE